MRCWVAYSLMVVCLTTTMGAFAEKECDGPFKGKKPTEEQLTEVLLNHQAWIDAGLPDSDERRANLCKADLSEAGTVSKTITHSSWPQLPIFATHERLRLEFSIAAYYGRTPTRHQGWCD